MVCVVVFLLVCGCCILFLLVTYYFSVFSAATCDPHVGASMFALTCHLRAFSFAVIKNITYASYNSCVSLHFYVVAFEAGCNILTAGIATLSRRRSSDPCNHHCVWIVSQQLLISLKLELPDRCCAHSLYCCGDPSWSWLICLFLAIYLCCQVIIECHEVLQPLGEDHVMALPLGGCCSPLSGSHSVYCVTPLLIYYILSYI